MQQGFPTRGLFWVQLAKLVNAFVSVVFQLIRLDVERDKFKKL